jgi:hypothetical protein
MQSILSALGASHVNVNGNEWNVGGVFLDTRDEVISRTYWNVMDGTERKRWQYDVIVSVCVVRREAPDGR